MGASDAGDGDAPDDEPPPEREIEPFEDFYRREYRGLVALSAALIRDRSMAEDIAQEALVAAYKRWEEVGRLESPIGWTRRVVMNKSASVVRRRLIELRAITRLASERRDVAPPESDADFWRLVRKLPRRQAQVIALFFVADLSVIDIAHVLGCKEGSVKSSLSKARQHLRAELPPEPKKLGEDGKPEGEGGAST